MRVRLSAIENMQRVRGMDMDFSQQDEGLLGLGIDTEIWTYL